MSKFYRMACVVVCVCLMGILLVPTATGDVVGTLPGEFTVDNKGAANYTIPLQVPPGVNGMQPELSISYNSQSGNGVMGMGWRINTGFPEAITRGRNFFARHGKVRGVAFDDEDKFYLDGKLLICVSGIYGKPGSVYRTEVDSFVEITALGADDDIKSFELVEKDGSRIIFGMLDDSTDACDVGQLTCTGTRGDLYGTADTPRSYNIKAVYDSCNNLILFGYVSPSEGECLLSDIEYSTVDGMLASVCLNYGERDDIISSFMNLKRFVVNSLVSSVVIKYNNSSLSEYGFSYENAPDHGPSRLTSVGVKYFASGVTYALADTIFEWSDGAVSFDELYEESGPGIWSYNTWLSSEDKTKPVERFAFGDFNGDGKDDYLDMSSGSRFHVGLSNGSGFNACTDWGYSLLGACHFVKVCDINGDGMKDVLFGMSSGQKWAGDAGKIYAVVSTGNRFVGLDGASAPTLVWALGQNTYNKIYDYDGEQLSTSMVNEKDMSGFVSRISVADFNGDARDDILIHRYDGQLSVKYSHGTSYSEESLFADLGLSQVTEQVVYNWFTSGVITSPRAMIKGVSVMNGASVSPLVSDVNGDGMADYLWSELYHNCTSYSHEMINTIVGYNGRKHIFAATSLSEQGFSAYDSIASNGWSGTINYLNCLNQVFQGDINGDGSTDSFNIKTSHVRDVVYYGTELDEYYPSCIIHLSAARVDSMPRYYIKDTIPEYVIVNDESVEPWSRPITMSNYYGSRYDEIASAYSRNDLEGFLGIKTSLGGTNMMLADMNDDGKDDYLWYSYELNVPSWCVMYSLGESFSEPELLNKDGNGPDWNASSQWGTRVGQNSGTQHSQQRIDINGDGLSDWAEFMGGSLENKQSLDQIFINTSIKGNLLIGITDGLGRRTEIKYKPATDSTVYTAGPVDDPSTSEVDGVAYPIRELRSAMYVVADVYNDFGNDSVGENGFGNFGDPVYDENGNKIRDVYHISYQYSGGRTDVSGRGFLGFQSFVTLDRQTNLFKYQFLAQSFPMTGLTVREQTYKASNVCYDSDGNVTSVDLRLINSKDNTVRYDEVKDPASSTLWGTLYPFTPYSVERRWEDGSAHFTGISESQTLFKKPLPAGSHSNICAFTWIDEQDFSGNVNSLPALPSPYKSNETAPSAAGFENNPATASPVGFSSWSDFAGFAMPGKITYGNLRKTLLDYSDGYQTETVSEYYEPSSDNGNRADLVKRTQTSVKTPSYAAWEAGPVVESTYTSQGLLKTRTTDCAASDTISGFRAVTNGNASLSIGESYTYTNRGLLESSTIFGGAAGDYDIGGSHVTKKVTAWDPTGRFPQTVVDAMGHAITTHYDAFGRAVEITDYNGQHTRTTYDVLGRVVKSEDILRGLTTNATYGFTGSSVGYDGTQTVIPPDGLTDALTLSSKYYVRDEATVTPPVTTYYDRIGRQIRSVKEGFNGLNTITDTIYNRDGEVVAISSPYTTSNSATKVWTLTTYDDLGRVKAITAPNGTITTNTYSGRVTQASVKAIGKDAQVSTTLVNVKGETVAVWNPDNTPSSFTQTSVNDTPSIKYVLDGFGRMRTTCAWQGGGTYANITSSYDALGNQTQLVDPDKGTWNYVYNALGQLTRQADANGAVTLMTYDWMGRPLARTITQTSGAVETTNTYYYETLAALPSSLPSEQLSHMVEDADQQWIGAIQRETNEQTGPGTGIVFDYDNSRAYYYNNLGQQYLDLYNIDNKWFYRSRDYDEYGRVIYTTYSWRPPELEGDMDSLPYIWQSYGYGMAYDSESYVLSVSDTQGRTWWQADESNGYDWLDRPVLYQKGGPASYWTNQEYDVKTGLLLKTTTGPLQSGNVIGWTVQRNEYLYDRLGNLISREDVKRDVTETFGYDNLNRLTSASVGDETSTYAYAINGNITSKTDVEGNVSSYAYKTAKIHAIHSAYGYAYGYDSNGNVNYRSGNDELWAFSYTGFDKPRWMGKRYSGATTYERGSAFTYGPDHMRVMHLEFDSFNKPNLSLQSGWTPLHYTEKKIYVANGSLELDYKNTLTANDTSASDWHLEKARVYIPSPAGNVGTAELVPDATNAMAHKSLVYHYDHLGSIQAITKWGETGTDTNWLYQSDISGKQSLYSYDPWGQRRDARDWSGSPKNQKVYAPSYLPQITWGWDDPTTTTNEDDLIPRGFTGHEQLDDLGLIHMNGRIYDPLTGRFLSADQVIQSPLNLQSYNRYSYCMNNPTGYVDPSGYSAEYPNPHDDPWTTVVYDGTIQYDHHTVAETRAEGVLDSVDVGPDQATDAVDNENGSAGSSCVTNTVRVPIVGDDNFVIGWLEVDASSVASALLENSAYSAELEATQSASVLVPAIGVGGFAGSEAGASILSPSVLGLLVFALTCPGDSCVSKTENSTNEGALAYERVYRVWGGGSAPWGQSWTPVDPRLDIANYRNLAGLPNANTGQFLSVGLLFNKSGLEFKDADPLDGNVGGWPEYVIPAPMAQVKLLCVYTLPPPLHIPYLE